MNNFLELWDRAIREAQETGKAVTLQSQDHMLGKPYPVARTMHPSFMGSRPPKYDPQRDKPFS